VQTDELRELFAGNLIRLRKLGGYSQERLAEVCGLHRTEVSLLERMKRSPRLETLIILSRGLECDPAALLAGIEIGTERAVDAAEAAPAVPSDAAPDRPPPPSGVAGPEPDAPISGLPLSVLTVVGAQCDAGPDGLPPSTT
jgi:transcriptional regulator with XRE-family HTH domain